MQKKLSRFLPRIKAKHFHLHMYAVPLNDDAKVIIICVKTCIKRKNLQAEGAAPLVFVLLMYSFVPMIIFINFALSDDSTV